MAPASDEKEPMTKLIRFDEEHFGYLIDHEVEPDMAKRFFAMFKEYWPDKELIIMQADEFIDLTGQYEIVSISDTAA